MAEFSISPNSSTGTARCSSAIWKVATLANDLQRKKYIYIYIHIDWLLSSFVHMCITVVSSISQAVSPYFFFASSLWARIFEAHAHACGPSFVSIPSYQSHINSFPHKPFWHTRMAYIQPSYLSRRELRKLAIYIYISIYIYMYMNDIYTYMNDIYEWYIYIWMIYIYI